MNVSVRSENTVRDVTLLLRREMNRSLQKNFFSICVKFTQKIFISGVYDGGGATMGERLEQKNGFVANKGFASR